MKQGKHEWHIGLILVLVFGSLTGAALWEKHQAKKELRLMLIKLEN